MTVDIAEARRLLTQIVVGASITSMERGWLGRINTDASITFQVKGKAGYVYVTRQDGTLEEAINKPNIPLTESVPVEFRFENGHYVIHGPATHPSVPFVPIPRRMADLTDVDDTGVMDGFVLIYDGTNEIWDVVSYVDLLELFRLAPGSPLSTDPGEAGEMRYDTTYLYVCVVADTWKRIALSAY